jgi:hypothetical protein
LRCVVNGCVLLTLVALGGQVPGPRSADLDLARVSAARESLERAHAASPSDAAVALKLIAAQALSGDYQRATELAASLLARGELRIRDTARAAGTKVGRVFAALVTRPPDVTRALALLEAAPTPPAPSASDIAWPFARAFALARSGESHAAAAVLERLAQRLRGDSGLQIANLDFATRVSSFGVYEEDVRRHFRPGDSVLIYAEPRGFRSTTVAGSKGRRWRVQLRMRLSVRAVGGDAEAANWGPDNVTHLARSRITDLHVTRVIRLPIDLSPGMYELRLALDDLAGEVKSGLAIKRLTVVK